MKIDEMIAALHALRDAVGGDSEVPFVTTVGENDYILPSYPIVGDFEDQDGNKFKCAFIGSSGGEEFTERGIPHYEWKPSKNEFKFEQKRFDGYVHISNEDMKKFPEPTIIDMSKSLLKVFISETYFEDATVNGNEEDPNSPKIPGYDTHTETVTWNIDIETGSILNWRPKTTACVNYKVVDNFRYEYDGFIYGPDYVPDFMGIDEKSYGDYVSISIDENGNIKNWSKENFLKEHEKIVNGFED